ncbi:protein YgfX [Microbulbifer pacificus]|uniref:Protein YgfX n=1 Tax=Microbulbifer pacificus TaxID=407164 RepID=A0AAU0N3A5_9GAMM|nr:protein YgfX [Microbulbifer pacificus]WOX06064.1 protein YgfX [Microbulbifer pacificus]
MCRSSVTTPACRTDTSAREAPARPGRAFAGHTGVGTERSARLACDFSPSRRLQRLLWLLAVQSLLLLAFSRLPWVAVGVASLLVFTIAWLEWQRLDRSVGRLSTAEKRWYWQVKGGARREFRFCGELTLWRWLIVINGRDLEGRRLRLVLSSDATGADDWRRLLVALRFSR